VTASSTAAPRVRAFLLDIEGTTTPVSFVYDVLFPYARRRLDDYLAARVGSATLTKLATTLADEWSADFARGEVGDIARPSADEPISLARYLAWLMDRDRKSPALKLVQGEIWETGYRDGELRGQVFEDVPSAFTRWSSAGSILAIYSSGSVLAQRLLFANSEMGDLTPAIAQYFDTAVGAKRSSESYTRIARALHVMPADIVFISDVDQELEAAREAGYRILMCARPGNAATSSRIAPTVHSFDEVDQSLGARMI
jgi:enolase-phosphatase E1